PGGPIPRASKPRRGAAPGAAPARRGASPSDRAGRPRADHQGRRQLGRLDGAARGDCLAGEAARRVVPVTSRIARERAAGHERDEEPIARLGQTGRAVLVTAETDERVGRATANLKEFEIRTPGTLRLADVLRAETVLVLRPALDALAARATVATVERADSE